MRYSATAYLRGSEENRRLIDSYMGMTANYLALLDGESPAGELMEDCALVLLKDDDINVAVIAGLASEPGVNGPAAAEEPCGAKRRHEVRNAGDRFWDRVHDC